MRRVLPCLLVITSSPAIALLLPHWLDKKNYQLQIGERESSKEILAPRRQPDLVIVDTLLLCEAVRGHLGQQVPLLVLSEVQEDEYVVKTLDKGADDYLRITMPFPKDELDARIQALLRRAARYRAPALPLPQILQSQDKYLTVNVAQRQVWAGKERKEVQLTPRECDLLCLLMKNAGKVLGHHQILSVLWGPQYHGVSNLKKVVERLRQKIEPDPEHPCYILAKPGVGYVFHALPPARVTSHRMLSDSWEAMLPNYYDGSTSAFSSLSGSDSGSFTNNSLPRSSAAGFFRHKEKR